MTQISKKLTGFISYAHKDKKYIKPFKDGLEAHNKLSNTNWSLWIDEDIIIGEKWHSKIKSKVASCDFAVLLISIDFINSEFIGEYELKEFLEQNKKNAGFTIIPVYLRPCEFDKHPELKDYQFFVADGEYYGYTAPIFKNLPYSKLVDDGDQSLLDTFHIQLLKKMEIALEKVIKNKSKIHEAPVSDYFHLIKNYLLKPEDIMGIVRGRRFYQDFYYVRPFDEKIKNHLGNNLPLLIKGNPLAGKSRAAFEAFRSESNLTVCIPKIEELQDKNIKIPIPAADNDERIIVFFDEIVDAFRNNSKSLNLFLFDLFRNNMKIVATCRTGNELVEWKNKLNKELWLLFSSPGNQILIPKISKEELRNEVIPNVSVDKKLNDFDRNIGSMFVNLQGMRRRYQRFRAIQDVNPVPEAILFALKCHYNLLNYEGNKSIYLSSKIKEQCERELGVGINPQKWHSSLDELAENDEGESFVYLRGKYIYTEEVYLDVTKRVIAPSLNLDQIFNIVYFQLFTSIDELKEYGWAASVYEFAKVMKYVSFEEARQIFDKMKELGVEPDVVIYGILIDKCYNYEQVMAFLTEMEAASIEPNDIIFNSAIHKAGNYSNGEFLFKEMQRFNVSPDVITFNTLMNLAPSFDQREAVFGQMKEFEVEPNERSFTTLMKYATFKQGEEILKQMKAVNAKPDVVTFTTLMSKSTTINQADQVAEMMKKADVKPNDRTRETYRRKTGKNLY